MLIIVIFNMNHDITIITITNHIANMFAIILDGDGNTSQVGDGNTAPFRGDSGNRCAAGPAGAAWRSEHGPKFGPHLVIGDDNHIQPKHLPYGKAIKLSKPYEWLSSYETIGRICFSFSHFVYDLKSIPFWFGR